MMQNFVQRLTRWDRAICIGIFRLNGHRPIDRLMFAFSHFGYGYAYPFIGLVLVLFDFSNTRQMIPAGFVSFFIEHTTHQIMKRKTKRLRPFRVLPEIRNLMRSPDEFSFPSGHAAGAFLMATLVNHFYPVVTIPAYAFASLIGISRVYNGMHYPSDVMAGSFLGYLSARIALLLVG